MDSVWVKTALPELKSLQKLPGKTEVLIIGGGLAGILCAYMLKNAGIDCVVAEAGQLCSGVTQNTTAKITLQHGLLYHRLLQRFGVEKTRLYLQAQQNALTEYARLCQSIDCDYQTRDSYVYSTGNRAEIEAEVTALHRLGVDAVFCPTVDLPIDMAGAVLVKAQAQFHPLKFALSLAWDLPIYQHTKVLELLPYKAVTNRGEIQYQKSIVATHFPFINKHGGYFLKMYQHRSYVLALENAPKIGGMYVDAANTGLSFRNYKNLLLLGGGGHRTGHQGGNWRVLEEFARRHYPSAKAVAKWAAQDCITLDGLPYIGRYAKNTPHLYVATGFNKWGMTSAMASAQILTDLVQNNRSPFAPVFDPARSIWHPQLAANAFSSAAGLLTPTLPRCPHLGCALKYNPQEHSWDCPCHGSRFAEDGQLLNGPATDDKH